MTNSETLTPGDILNDPKSMLEVWKDERRSRDFNATLLWDNLKLFSVLIPAVITVETFFLKLVYEGSVSKPPPELVWLSLVFPFVIILLSTAGIFDLYRRWIRTLEAIAHLNKLENYLGLDKCLPPEKRLFKNDTRLFQRFYDETKDKKGKVFDRQEDYIKNKRFKFNMFTTMAAVYFIFPAIGIFLLVSQW